MRKAAFALGLVLLATASAGAGEGDDLTPGARVRITAVGAPGSPAPTLVGTLVRLEGDDLIVMGDGRSTSRVPRPLVDRIEIAWGRKSHIWKGLIIGAAAGALVGAVGDPGTDPSGARLTRGQSVGQCAVGGAALGALIGALVKTDQWVEVPAGPLRIRAGSPPGRGVGVSMGVAF